jgi:hypothetical protein
MDTIYANTHYPVQNTVNAMPKYARGKRRYAKGKRINTTMKPVKRAGGKRVARGCRKR